MNQQQRAQLLKLVEKLTDMPAEAFDLSKAEQRIALLVGMGLLDPSIDTSSRVTPEQLALYQAELKEISEPTCTIELTSRELTLVHAACIRRRDKLKRLGTLNAEQSYNETRELINGKLCAARKQFTLEPTGESK